MFPGKSKQTDKGGERKGKKTSDENTMSKAQRRSRGGTARDELPLTLQQKHKRNEGSGEERRPRESKHKEKDKPKEAAVQVTRKRKLRRKGETMQQHWQSKRNKKQRVLLDL